MAQDTQEMPQAHHGGSRWREGHFPRGGQGREGPFRLGWGPLPTWEGGRQPCTRPQAAYKGQGGARHEKERPPDRKAKGPQKEMEGEVGKEKCDIPARDREKRGERERETGTARAPQQG